MSYRVEIIADSCAPNGKRLTTMEITFPRFVLAEFNTHRMFSRNSASSRAIPISKRIAAVRDDPFIPEAFGKNRKGMQSTVTLEGVEAEQAREEWMRAADQAVQSASRMEALGVHKQYANRLLEPYLWHTAVVSATEWANFFHLRCSPLAQPEIRTVAEMMRDAYQSSAPSEIDEGQWHLPYIRDEDRAAPSRDSLLRVSVARCARVAYLTHDGVRDTEKDIELAEKLSSSGHWSPFEHVARAFGPDAAGRASGNFFGWWQFRKWFGLENVNA